MGHAVELFIESPSAEAICKLFKLTDSLLGRIGASPHVSLAVFEGVDISKLIEVVASFAEDTAAFNIRFSSIGIFPGEENIVFLAPVMTIDLLMLHERFHDRLNATGLTSDPYYLPGTWVPHCTITMEEQLPRTLETIRSIHQETVLKEYPVSDIHVVEFRPVVSLASFKLSGRRIEQSRAADPDKSPS